MTNSDGAMIKACHYHSYDEFIDALESMIIGLQANRDMLYPKTKENESELRYRTGRLEMAKQIYNELIKTKLYISNRTKVE